jgi:hypothetical protein
MRTNIQHACIQTYIRTYITCTHIVSQMELDVLLHRPETRHNGMQEKSSAPAPTYGDTSDANPPEDPISLREPSSKSTGIKYCRNLGIGPNRAFKDLLETGVCGKALRQSQSPGVPHDKLLPRVRPFKGALSGCTKPAGAARSRTITASTWWTSTSASSRLPVGTDRHADPLDTFAHAVVRPVLVDFGGNHRGFLMVRGRRVNLPLASDDELVQIGARKSGRF